MSRTSIPKIIELSVIYFLSGFCALIYQMVWIRKFSLIFGSSVFAVSIVVAVFLGGLAAGSHIFGKISLTVKNPVRLYGFLEIIISIYALAFPFILYAAESIYPGLYVSSKDVFIPTLLLRAVTAIIILILPVSLMGGTLPVISKHFVKDISSVGGQAGLIYGLNALGAAIGSVMAGYLLFNWLGVSNTNTLAAFINLLIGGAALMFSKAPSFSASEKSPQKWKSVKKNQLKKEADYSKVTILVFACFTLSGFVTMSYEIFWLRYLVFFFRNTIYLYSGTIAIFIVGFATGSLTFQFFEKKINAPVTFYGFLQLCIGITIITSIYLPVRWYDFIYVAGEKSGLNLILFLFAFLFIPTFFMGVTFPLVTRIITDNLNKVSDYIGKAYAYNTGGMVLGSILTGFFFFSIFGIQTTLYILFAANMIMAATLILSDKDYKKKYWGTIPLLLCIIFPLVMVFGVKNKLPHMILDKKIQPHTQIIEIKEGLTGTTWVTKADESLLKLWEDSVTISKGNEGSFLVQGFIPMLVSPKIPQSVLGLTFGGGLSYYATSLFPEVKRMDFVDISRENVAAALEHFPENSGLKHDSRVNFIFDDAYNFVKYSRKKYDLILMEPTPPMFSYKTAALYTKEFYKYAKNRLEAGGLFAQIIPLGNLSKSEIKNVMKTFGSQFQHTLMWWNERDCLMIGSERDFNFNIAEIDRRLNRTNINESLKKFSKKGHYYLTGNLISGIMLTTGDFKRIAEKGNIYTDDWPGLEFTTGKDISSADIELIYNNLTPWREIKTLFPGFNDFDQYTAQFRSRRQYLMTLFYSDFPLEFYERFQKYINKYSTTRLYDLRLLHAYLTRYGLSEKAKHVKAQIDLLEKEER